jgi:Coenzyme PQQ synthesis protein D (PqqD)
MSRPSITLQSIVARTPDVVGSKIEDRMALMSIRNGAYYGMDPVGSRVWDLIARSVRVSDVCESLLGEFEVDRATCERQVLAFLQQLADADLLDSGSEKARETAG